MSDYGPKTKEELTTVFIEQAVVNEEENQIKVGQYTATKLKKVKSIEDYVLPKRRVHNEPETWVIQSEHSALFEQSKLPKQFLIQHLAQLEALDTVLSMN